MDDDASVGQRKPGPLRLGGHEFAPGRPLVMAIVNRTPDSLGANLVNDTLAATGWPVLLSASHKDFVGETLDAPIDGRLAGTLAVTSVGAWLGARIFRAHDVRATRQALDMVASIKGDRPPARAVRALA